MGLTDKQERFVQELLSGKTDRQAYYIAYPRSKNWKPQYVDTAACELKVNPKVARRLEAARKRIEERTEITAERVMQQLANIAFADQAELYDESGRLKPINELPKSITTTITSVEMTVDKDGNQRFSYKFNNKDKSLQLLTQILGMLQAKPKDDKPIEIEVDYG